MLEEEYDIALEAEFDFHLISDLRRDTGIAVGLKDFRDPGYLER